MQLPDWKYWLYQRGIDIDRFELRETLNANPIITLGAAGVVVFICLMLVVCQFTGGGPASVSSYKVIYYDTSNKTLKVVDHNVSDGMHPSPMKGTTDVFEVMLFYCGESPGNVNVDGMTVEQLEEKGIFIGWLQKIDPEQFDESIMSEGHMYRAVDGKDWVPVYEPEVEKIINMPYQRCSDARPFQIR